MSVSGARMGVVWSGAVLSALAGLLVAGCGGDEGAAAPSLIQTDSGGVGGDPSDTSLSDGTPNAGLDVRQDAGADGTDGEPDGLSADSESDTAEEPGGDTVSPQDLCVGALTGACAICESSADCAADAECVAIDGELRCAPSCDVDTPCEAGFICAPAGAGAGSLCVPATGSCGCCAAADGDKRACEGLSDGCDGTQTCSGSIGWSTCTFTSTQAELCDGLDNDCDGLTDEDFKDADGAFTLDSHCGECGGNCVGLADHGQSVCGGSDVAPSCELVACEVGYQLQDGLCVLGSSPGSPCAACAADVDCPGGRCAALDGTDAGKVCLPSCDGGAACLSTWSCSEVDGANLCVPPSGTCSCTSATDGVARACTQSNSVGSCAGVETCHAATGWSECSAGAAEAEVCDGLDNDCDGTADEDLVGVACSVEVAGVGACLGVERCAGADGWVCDGATPAAETCNGVDDDCDGEVDEDFRGPTGAYVADTDCGTCGNDCQGQIIHGTAACALSGGVARCVAASCEPPYVALGDGACVLPPSLSCAACSDDGDCGGGSCVPLAGALVCVLPCNAGGGCDDVGTVCTDLGEGGALMRCVPAAGACTCEGENVGLERSCQVANGVGTCVGRETCGADGAWSGCSALTPADEVCNGLDDDCDGVIDDGLPAGGACELAASGVGTCTGTAVCQGAQGWACIGKPPTPEVCDLVDNDCDGLVDEGFTAAGGAYQSDDNCGICGNDCANAIPGGTGRCGGSAEAPFCVVDSCDAGLVPLSAFACGEPILPACEPCTQDAACGAGAVCAAVAGSPVCAKTCALGSNTCPSGYVCAPHGAGGACLPASGTCDCEAATDGLSRTCTVSTLAGTCRGAQVCDGASQGWSTCSAAVPTTEACNGVDDDCNGLIDDLIEAPAPSCSISNAYGTCVGSWTCEAAWSCGAKTPAAELCDGLDNDCDGTTDEDFIDAGSSLLLGDHHCGTCSNDCVSGIANGVGKCVAKAGVAACEVVACDPGYQPTSAGTCAPIRLHCAPCVSDADCAQPGDSCLTVDGQQVCATHCGAGNPYQTAEGVCEGGFVCAPQAAGAPLCLPVSGSCSCLPGNEGSTRACASQNGLGTCAGIETCSPTAGWLGCTAAVPAAELCNGADDDCDGTPDDDLIGPPCAEQAGVCAGAAQTCGGAAGYVACGVIEYGPDYEAEEATCDGLDNDCDGLVDEGYVGAGGGYTTDLACGSCAANCVATFTAPYGHGYGRCGTTGAPACELVCCTPGDPNPACDGRTWTDANGDPTDGCESSPCVTNLECGPSKYCDAGVCTGNASGGPCDDDVNCPDGQQCVGGFCGCDGSLFTSSKVPPNVLIVLDRSGSMNDKIGGQSKWNIAKAAIGKLIATYGAEVRFGLMLYPGTNKSGSQGKSCSAGAVFVDPAEGTGSTITTFLGGAGTTSFGTPTAASMAWLANYAGLKDTTRENYVLLITDGQSSCNNNPNNEVAALLAKSPSIKTFAVGFGSGVSATELNGIALAGGVPRPNGPPHYYKADSAADLEASLDTIGGTVLSCSYALNQVPADVSDLYVLFDGVLQTRDPSHAAGWDYSLGNNNVSFFGDACSSLKAGTVESLVMVYGCAGVIQ